MGVRPETLELTRTHIPGLELPLLARLDMAHTPDGFKLLEYNGEAAGLVVETFGLNAFECEDKGMRDVNAASLAALTTAMRAALQRAIEHVGGPFDRALVAFAYNVRSDRGRAAARYLAQIARDSSGLHAVDVPVESLSLSDDHLRLQDGRPVAVLWRPCSVRYLGAALSASDTAPDECAASIARLVRESRLAVIDAPDTSLLSSKAAQAVIWGLTQTGQYFSDAEAEIVRTYFLPTALDPPADGEPYVIKPAFGSEGDSITIVDPGRDEVRRSMCTSYQGEAHVYQQFVSLPARNVMTEHGIRPLHVVTSCFLVSGRPSGIIFRAGGEITSEDAWVVPAGW
jgi:glutathionylspermidine synthase